MSDPHVTSWQQRRREQEEQESIEEEIAALQTDEELEAHGANDPTEDTISYNESEEESVDEFIESIDLT